MDTRTKIVPPDRVQRDPSRALTLLLGCFDPYYAVHARRIGELAQPGTQLVIALDDGPWCVLPREARAEVVAALEAVDYVLLDASEALAVLQADRVVDERDLDRERAEALRVHVLARQSAAS